MENKTLIARCANPECNAQLSTEVMVGVTVGRTGYWRQITICAACADKGWRPKNESAAN
jgi:hypothetical protein